MTLFVIIVFIGLLWIGGVTNRIPKTGRDADANGERITATITNNNKTADKAVTLRAEKDGRKFKVKMKPTEAHLWIKGDSIDILLSDKPGKYRVLFNDYFRNNEERIREKALEKLKKVDLYLISKNIVKYKKEYFELFKNSKLESQRIFAFASYMRMIDLYTVMTVIFGIAVLVWRQMRAPQMTELIIAVVVLLILIWTLYSVVQVCKRIIKEVQA